MLKKMNSFISILAITTSMDEEGTSFKNKCNIKVSRLASHPFLSLLTMIYMGNTRPEGFVCQRHIFIQPLLGPLWIPFLLVANTILSFWPWLQTKKYFERIALYLHLPLFRCFRSRYYFSPSQKIVFCKGHPFNIFMCGGGMFCQSV